AGEAGLKAAERLLQGFGEGAPDGHGLAHRLHGGGQAVIGTGEFFEGKARNLGDDIVDGGFERGRGSTAGDVVFQLIEGVADGETGCDLGNGEPGRLGGERRGARYARVHFDDDQTAIRRIDGELDVGAAGLHTDLAQHRDRCVAHDLVFLVGEGDGGGDSDRVAGVHAHGIDVFDRADDDAVVVLVANDFHLVFLPPQNAFLD